MARIRTRRGCVWALAVADQWIPEAPSADYEVERYTALLDGREVVLVSVYQGERDLFSDGYDARCTVAPHLPRDRFDEKRAAAMRARLAQALHQQIPLFAGADAPEIAAALRDQAARGPEVAGAPVPGPPSRSR